MSGAMGLARGRRMRKEEGQMGSTHDERGQAHRQAILILGMHRSGTSALSGVLALLGVSAPKTLIAGDGWNERGYWESDRIGRFNDRVLASAGSTWNDWGRFNPAWMASVTSRAFAEELPSLIGEEFEDAQLLLVKDPRICRFVSFWRKGLDDLGIASKVIIPVRNPLEVAQSLRRRDGMPLSEGLLLWLRHCLDAEYATRETERAFLHYEALLEDWPRVIRQISEEIDLSFPRWSSAVEVSIDSFLSRDLRHNVVSKQSFNVHGRVFEWAKKAYEALGLLIETAGVSTEAMRELDRVRDEFDRASEIVGSVVQHHKEASAALDQKIVALNEDMETKLARLEGHVLGLAIPRSIAAGEPLTIAVKMGDKEQVKFDSFSFAGSGEWAGRE